LVLGLLLFRVELISYAARLLSLTVRLWANIFASDLIDMIFLGLLLGRRAGLEQSPSLGISGVVSGIVPDSFHRPAHLCVLLQAYIFYVLPSIYLGLAQRMTLGLFAAVRLRKVGV